MSNRINLGNIKGATGATGPQGLPGQNGANGLTPEIRNGNWWIGAQDLGVQAEGNKWYKGSAVPTNQGINGDLYLRTTTNDVYYKENGAWSIVTNIKGDTALSVQIGTVTTVSPNTPASVTNSGTDTDLVLDFEIPKGQDGATTIKVNAVTQSEVNFDSDPQTQLNGKELASNKVTSLDSSSNNTQYPSAKAVYDYGNRVLFEGTTTQNGDFYITGLNIKDGDTVRIEYNGGATGALDLLLRINEVTTSSYYSKGIAIVDNFTRIITDTHQSGNGFVCGYINTTGIHITSVIELTVRGGSITGFVTASTINDYRHFYLDNSAVGIPITSIRFSASANFLKSGAKVKITKI